MPSERLPHGAGAAPGRAWCQARSASVDEAIAGWWASTGLRGAAVFALGGYARRELCPASDVDLLLLHDGRRSSELQQMVQAVVYPLWDAGLSVGYAVHTPADVLRKARGELTSATALVDRRLVTGDVGLADQLAARVTRLLRQDGRRLVRELAAADLQRRQKAGERAGLLEPDLKNGAGGLRDLASLRWAAAALLGEASLARLVGARYVGAAEYRELVEAEQILLQTRCALHLALGATRSGTAADRLRLDVQGQVAERVDQCDGDALLHRVGLAMRSVAHTHQRVWPRLLDDARRGRSRKRAAPQRLGDGLSVVDGCVELDDAWPGVQVATAALQAAAAAAVRGLPLGRLTAARLRRDVEGRELSWTSQARAAFISVLRAGPRARPALADLDHAGVLAALLPGWDRVRGRPQRNPYHRFDVDTHGVEAVAELVELVEGPGPAASLWAELGGQRQRILLLGAFLHDVGKGWEGDHSEQGAAVAKAWMRHLGLAEHAEQVATLVAHHLLLPDAATRRDVSDIAEVDAVAAAVADVRTLDSLYLLALADGRATGPAASTPWRERMLGEAHARVRARLGCVRATRASPA